MPLAVALVQGRHRPRRRPPLPPTHRWGAGGSRGVPRTRDCVGVRHTAAARGRGGPARRGARGALPSALCMSLAVELVRGRHRPRCRPLPPPTHRRGAGDSRGDPRHPRLLLRHLRRLRPRHRRRRRGPQPPHPPRACVARDRASARPLHGGSSASRSRLRGYAALRSACVLLGCPSPNIGVRLYLRGEKCLTRRRPLVLAWSCPRTRTEVGRKVFATKVTGICGRPDRTGGAR